MSTREVDLLRAIEGPARSFASKAVERLKLACGSGPVQLVDLEHGIAWRIKSEAAIAQKLKNPGRIINDFIGIRVLCESVRSIAFVESLAAEWSKEIGLECVKREDVFKHPDVSGYRAIHLDYVLARPGDWGLVDEATVEVQVTTWLHHYHNVISHGLYYKPETPAPPSVVEALRELSMKIDEIENRVDQMLGHGK